MTYRSRGIDESFKRYERELKDSMAKSVNKVLLLGNVGKDIEFTCPDGLSIAKFSIATNEREKVNGEWQDRAEWHSIICFDRLADIVRQYVNKGSKLYVEGRLKTHSWEKDGVRKYRTEIIASEIALLGDPSGREPGSKG